MDLSIFKSYDIRGIYPNEINEGVFYCVGRATAEYLKAHAIAVGRDTRASSPALFDAFTKGITDEGCDVYDLGLASTPVLYFASGQLPVEGAVSLTASHNPPEYNGLKISRAGAVPIGGSSGLFEIRDLALKGDFSESAKKGRVISTDIKKEYADHIGSFFTPTKRKLKIVTDTANMMGALELDVYRKFPEHIELIAIHDDLSKPFQTHEANPLKTETLDELRKKVIETAADFGVAYDGDADRVGFVDEKGDIVPMDIMTALLTEIVLKSYPGATILYDLRSSRSVKEVIEEMGGVGHECMVGHANIKKQMREEGAVFAGELSGHYYFKENMYAESGTLAAIFLMNLLNETGRPLSELAQRTRRYFHSGEINIPVGNTAKVLETLKEKYSDGKQNLLDGLKVSYPDWWVSVRASNTEPLLRLNLEAKTKGQMEEKKKELLRLLAS